MLYLQLLKFHPLSHSSLHYFQFIHLFSFKSPEIPCFPNVPYYVSCQFILSCISATFFTFPGLNDHSLKEQERWSKPSYLISDSFQTSWAVAHLKNKCSMDSCPSHIVYKSHLQELPSSQDLPSPPGILL